MKKEMCSVITGAISLFAVLLMTSCSSKINIVPYSGASSQAAKTESSSVDTLEQYYDRCDATRAASDFLMNVQYQKPDPALAYTTKTEEIINCVNLAVDPDTTFNSQTWDDDTRYIMIDLLLPIMKSLGNYYNPGQAILTSDTTAEVEVYVKNFSCQKSITELRRRVDNLSERDIKHYRNLYSGNHGALGEDEDQDKFKKYILEMVSSGLINSQSELSESYTYSIYLEKIDGDWIVTNFSNNDDFVDTFLWGLSKMKN